MPLTNAENQAILNQRRQAAYVILKMLAIELGIMKSWKDSSGYDKFIKLLEGGEFELRLVSKNDKNQLH